MFLSVVSNAASGSLNQFLPSQWGQGKTCHHSQHWQTVASFPRSSQKSNALLYKSKQGSPLSQPLSWRPRFSVVLRQSHRKTGALPPVHAAYHQTHLWATLQECKQNISVSWGTQQASTFSKQTCDYAQEIASQHQPEGWILLTKNRSITAVTPHQP